MPRRRHPKKEVEAAALSAIADLESVEGIEVIRIADAGLASIPDIATRTGRTRESVRLLVEGKRGPGGFPAPVTDPTRRRHRLWYWRPRSPAGSSPLASAEPTATRSRFSRPSTPGSSCGVCARPSSQNFGKPCGRASLRRFSE